MPQDEGFDDVGHWMAFRSDCHVQSLAGSNEELPTPRQIIERAAEVRERWTRIEEQNRRGILLQDADDKLFTVPLVETKFLPNWQSQDASRLAPSARADSRHPEK